MTRERTTTWDDPAISAAQVGREPGLSLLEAVRDGRLPAAPIARTLGFDLAVHSTLPAGVGYTSIDLNVKFLRGMSVSTGRVTCEGRVVNRGRRLVLAEATLTDAAGRLLATASSSCLLVELPG